MWKSWLKRVFSSSGQKHPLDRKPTPLNKHPLGEQVANVILYSQNEAKRLQQQTIGSSHILLALTKYPYGLAQKALAELGIVAEKVETLIPNDDTPSNVPSGAFLILPEVDAIFKKAQDEARYFKRDQIVSEHILLALAQFEEMTAYRILQQLNITPNLLREKVYELVAKEVLLDGTPSRTDPEKIERFTKRVRHVLNISQQIAEQRHDLIIGVEYLMIALLREGGGIACRTLLELAVTTEKLEPIIYAEMKRTPPEGKLGELSADVKRALEFAVDEARRRNLHYIGTEHLLMGLMRQKNLLPVKALGQLGVTPQMVLSKIKVVLAEQASQ